MVYLVLDDSHYVSGQNNGTFKTQGPHITKLLLKANRKFTQFLTTTGIFFIKRYISKFLIKVIYVEKLQPPPPLPHHFHA